jgi:hypothetical protein
LLERRQLCQVRRDKNDLPLAIQAARGNFKAITGFESYLGRQVGGGGRGQVIARGR